MLLSMLLLFYHIYDDVKLAKAQRDISISLYFRTWMEISIDFNFHRRKTKSGVDDFLGGAVMMMHLFAEPILFTL
jgi:hypothetical protein